jgi:hypothetical protein
MIWLSQFIPVLFYRNPLAKAITLPLALARCARYSRAIVRLAALSSWQGGSFAPRCIPQTRSVAPWTSPEALRLLDFRPGGVSPSGHPTAVSPAASTRRAFVPSMDLQTVGDFALPQDPHRPAVRRLDPRHGFRAPGSRLRGRSAPRPLTSRGWQDAMAKRGARHGDVAHTPVCMASTAAPVRKAHTGAGRQQRRTPGARP